MKKFYAEKRGHCQWAVTDGKETLYVCNDEFNARTFAGALNYVPGENPFDRVCAGRWADKKEKAA